MDNDSSLIEHLKNLRDVIIEERQAARDLAVERLLEFTDKKESLLKQLSPLVDDISFLSPEEKALAEEVYSENLRNAYFFWSALQWVRESVEFIADRMHPDAYGETGSMVREGGSGAIFSGRV